MNLFYLRFLRKLKSQKDISITISPQPLIPNMYWGQGKLQDYHFIAIRYKVNKDFYIQVNFLLYASSILIFPDYASSILIFPDFNSEKITINYSDIPMTDLAYGFAADKIINHIIKYCKEYAIVHKKIKKINENFEKPIY